MHTTIRYAAGAALLALTVAGCANPPPVSHTPNAANTALPGNVAAPPAATTGVPAAPYSYAPPVRQGIGPGVPEGARGTPGGGGQ